MPVLLEKIAEADSGGTATSITVNLTDSGTLDGDQLFLFLGKDDDTPTTTRPIEWTLICEINGETAIYSEVYYRVASGDDNSSYTWVGDSEEYAIQVLRAQGATAFDLSDYNQWGTDLTSVYITEPTPDLSLARTLIQGGHADKNGVVSSLSGGVSLGNKSSGTGAGSVESYLWEIDRGRTSASNVGFSCDGEEMAVFILTLYEATNKATGALTSTVSTLNSSVANGGDGVVRGRAHLGSTVSTLSGLASQVFDGTHRVRSHLSSTVSTCSGLVEHRFDATIYSLGAYCNISASGQTIDYFNFTLEIDGTLFPMNGFALRSSSANVGANISDIAEVQVYLSDADIASYIPQIGLINVTINSISSIGGIETSIVLFEGLLSNIKKNGLNSYAYVIATNSYAFTSAKSHNVSKTVTYSSLSARVKFNPSIEPNDSIVMLDGVIRKVLRVVHYSYAGRNSYTEVRSG